MAGGGYSLDVAGLVSGALSLVAALAWNEAAKKGIAAAYPFSGNDSVKATFAYALTVTLAIVVLFAGLQHLARWLEKRGGSPGPQGLMGLAGGD
jgi:hypothetical protein